MPGIKLPEKSFPGMVSREAKISFNTTEMGREETDFTKVAFPVTLASESPAFVIDWGEWKVIREVLLMDGVEMPGNKQVVMLDRHSCYGAVKESIKGSFRNLRSQGKEFLSDAFFSSLAMDECTLVREGHLTDVSCGYETFNEQTLKLKPGESGSINGRQFTNDYSDGLDLYIRGKWRPKEGSLVPIGADSDSKFREDQISLLQEEVRKLNEKLNSRSSITINSQENSSMAEPIEKTEDQIRAEERERVDQIEEYGQRFAGKFKDSQNKKREAIKNGWSADQFRMYVLDNMTASGPVDGGAGEAGMTDNQIREYSISKAITAVADGSWTRENSLEREASDEVAKKVGKDPQARAFYLPSDLQKRLHAGVNARAALSTQTISGGGALVGQDYLAGDFISFLRNKAVMPKLGATVLSGLSKDIVIPKQLSATVFQMTGYGAADQSFMTFGQVKASPKFGSATTEYHRSLVIQADPSIDFLITNDLFGSAVLGMDNYIINGLGGESNEPKGWTNETGIASVDCAGGIDWAKIVEMKKKLKKANADQLGEIKFLMSPDVEEILMTTPKAGAYPVFIMGDDGKLAGCRSEVSNQVSDGLIAAGIWSEVVLCDWNLYEVLVNPYGPNSKAGNIETTIFAAFDVVTKRAAAIAASKNVPISA